MKTAIHIRIFVLVLLVIFSFSQAVHGQTRDTCRIYFPQNSSYIVSDYLGNKESIANLKMMLAKPDRIDTLYINVTSSPEGIYSVNERISSRRAERIYNFVIRHSGGAVNPERIKVVVVPENWDGLELAVENRYFGKYRDIILDIFKNDSLTYDQKESQIRKIDDGKTWAYFICEYMPALRFADEVVILTTLHMPDIKRPFQRVSATPSVFKQHELKSVPVVSAPAVNRQKQFLFNIRTNLLYDIAAVPNLGMEFHLGKRFSLGVSYAHAWWANDSAHQYWRIYGGDVVLRKYFGGKENWSALSGHHLGAYAQCYSYDFELGARGQLSDLTYGAGLEYGYNVPLSRRISLDFSLGCAYLTGEYKVYEPEDECYVWKETRQRHYIGPTKAEISFVWLFGNRKGGAR